MHLEVGGGEILIDAAEKVPRRVKLPFSEAELLNGLDAYGVHADELALPSPGEIGADIVIKKFID
ncbi:MAG: MazF family transcriptional regulator [Gammaproteobacteria bacterium RIFCSPLOWO2_02_FULL_57_10]|nr:MAG: MazF family transcriptional regulator [Gammaproteobacteria bacterium RIFCSPLOWO2_02_FULL_57_10]